MSIVCIKKNDWFITFIRREVVAAGPITLLSQCDDQQFYQFLSFGMKFQK